MALLMKSKNTEKEHFRPLPHQFTSRLIYRSTLNVEITIQSAALA